MEEKILKIYPSNLLVKRMYLEITLLVYKVPMEEVRAYLLRYEEVMSHESEDNELKNKISFRENSEMTVLCAI